MLGSELTAGRTTSLRQPANGWILGAPNPPEMGSAKLNRDPAAKSPQQRQRVIPLAASLIGPFLGQPEQEGVFSRPRLNRHCPDGRVRPRFWESEAIRTRFSRSSSVGSIFWPCRSDPYPPMSVRQKNARLSLETRSRAVTRFLSVAPHQEGTTHN